MKDVRRVQRRLQAAVLAFAEVVAVEEDADALAALFAALDRSKPPHGLIQQLAVVRDGVSLALHVAIVDDPNHRRIFDGLGMIEASWQTSYYWDGPRLARMIAAQVADESYVNRLTGEVTPPGAFAEIVAMAIVACAGLDAKSKSWRKTDLTGRGIDVAEYREKSGESRKTVKWA
jgi:hypothetical protein